MRIIDTHAHIYSPDEKRYPTIDKPYRPPAGTGSLEHLRRVTKENGVEAACLIQTSTFYRFDNRYLCDSSRSSADWAAGVCTLDPDDPHSPLLLREFVREFGVRGMRSIPARDGKLDHPGVRDLWKTATDLGIVINVLVGREKAPEVDRMLGDFPKLRVVLDHCMNPKVGPDLESTLSLVTMLARHSHLHAKLTFLPTGSATGFPCRDMHEACLKIIRSYGPDRCVWGSSFPCELWTPRVSYAENLKLFTQELPLTNRERAAILGETAHRLWFAKR